MQGLPLVQFPPLLPLRLPSSDPPWTVGGTPRADLGGTQWLRGERRTLYCANRNPCADGELALMLR